MSTFLDFFNVKYYRECKYEDIVNYNLWDVFSVSKRDVLDLFDEFYKTEEFDRLPLVDGAKEGIETLCENNSVVFVTHRPSYISEKTQEYFSRHFPNKEYRIVHSHPKLKSEVCPELEVEVIIEDHAGCAYDCANIGLRAILFDRPWNQGHLYPGLIRVGEEGNHWRGAKKYIDKIGRNRRNGN